MSSSVVCDFCTTNPATNFYHNNYCDVCRKELCAFCRQMTTEEQYRVWCRECECYICNLCVEFSGCYKCGRDACPDCKKCHNC